MAKEVIDIADVQGLILSGYGTMPNATYLLLSITDAAQARSWLGAKIPEITTGENRRKGYNDLGKRRRKKVEQADHLNLAFTAEGIKAMGLDTSHMDHFNMPFREGMPTPHRQRLLGDYGTSSPANWEWGYHNGPDANIHMLLVIFSPDEAQNKARADKETEDLRNHGLTVVHTLSGHDMPNNKEHFGFRDGISNPEMIGLTDERKEDRNSNESSDDNIANGEILLGYKNEYGVYPETPLIMARQGNPDMLPLDPATGMPDLGKNGSYLVFRQIEQHVEQFWTYLHEQGKKLELDPTFIASKMVGRWPSGAPLVKFPDKDPYAGTDQLSDDDSFGYHKDDKEGLKCPMGSHLRRSNPRDAFEENGRKLSLKLSNKHRILRRARHYGDRVETTAESYKTTQPSGLMFMCFNADIATQFEFVQYTWCNFRGFNKLYNDPDPLIGVRNFNEDPQYLEAGTKAQEDLYLDLERKGPDGQPNYANQQFTIPQCPANRTADNLQRFVTIKGGGYFFMPSITALKYLTTL